MTMSGGGVDEKAAAEAAEWFTRLQGPAVSQRERALFSEWLRQSAAHVQEYLAVVSVWRGLGATEDARRPAAELILAAREDAGTTNIVPLGAPYRPGAAAAPGGTPRRVLRATAAALALAILGAAGWMAVDGYAGGKRYSTAVGEQRSFTLTDGTVLRLNTRSTVRVRYGPQGRDITLLGGEAMFEVARDARRPFRVHVEGAVVEAVGTAFNIYRAARDTRVTVLEGRVRVSPQPRGAVVTAPVELSPREQARVAADGSMSTSRLESLAKVVAWMDRRLIFEHETLATVVAEFNRYNTRRLEITDTLLAALRINGNFRATDPQSLVAFLERSEAVTVAPGRGEVVLLSRRAR